MSLHETMQTYVSAAVKIKERLEALKERVESLENEVSAVKQSEDRQDFASKLALKLVKEELDNNISERFARNRAKRYYRDEFIPEHVESELVDYNLIYSSNLEDEVHRDFSGVKNRILATKEFDFFDDKDSEIAELSRAVTRKVDYFNKVKDSRIERLHNMLKEYEKKMGLYKAIVKIFNV